MSDIKAATIHMHRTCHLGGENSLCEGRDTGRRKSLEPEDPRSTWFFSTWRFTKRAQTFFRFPASAVLTVIYATESAPLDHPRTGARSW